MGFGRAVLTTLAIGLVATPAVAAAPRIETLDQGPVALPQVAAAPDGTLVAVWGVREGNNMGALRWSVRRPSGRFRRPRTLDADAFNAPLLAMDARGRATALWVTDEGGVAYRARRPGRPFGRTRGLPARPGGGGLAITPVLDVAPNGAAIAAWTVDSERIVAAIRPAGGHFGSPMLVSEGWSPNALQVGIDGRGRAIVTWVRPEPEENPLEPPVNPFPGPSGSGRQVFEFALGTAEGFGPAQSFAPEGSNTGMGDLAVAEDGTTAIAWTSSNGALMVSPGTTREPLGGDAQAVPGDFGLELAFDLRGRAYSFAHGDQESWLGIRARGATTWSRERISAPHRSGWDAATDGSMIATWESYEPRRLLVARRPREGPFRTPRVLSAEEGILPFTPTVSAAGVAAVPWIEGEPARLRVAVFEERARSRNTR